jgi:hypothetical protein
MAGDKSTGATAKSKKAGARKAVRKSLPRKRAARDVRLGPTAQQIEQSITNGTKQPLAAFRVKIGW